MLTRVAVVLFVSAILTAHAQSLPGFPLRTDGPVLRQRVESGQPFTVAGLRGILVGQQQGPFEAWILPVKLLSHLTVEAEVEGYPVPLDLNTMAREIEVRPDRTTITYSHIALTVRQIMFSPDDATPIVLYQVDSPRPVTLTFRFTAEMREMWPKPSSGVPSAEWVSEGVNGFYALHTDFPTLTGAVTIPGATPGIMAPYQERPQVHPLELRLHVPANHGDQFYQLLMAAGRDAESSTTAALAASLRKLQGNLPQLYQAHVARLEAQEQQQTSLETPDASLNAYFRWAELSIEQLRALAPSGEVGLVAGYYASGDSARPGFGWYFGRDTLYTLYALHSFGDFALSRTALEFLMKRQRDDGKVMHEYSQTAGELEPPADWKSFPYEYAAADATPLFLTAMLDYVRTSGDVLFLRDHKTAILNAWKFETTHDADGDGIYDNSQGTGWVESWPPGMPKQEAYLALLDQQASSAMSTLAKLLGDPQLATAAADRAARLKPLIEREYYEPSSNSYAFSRNQGGALDHTATIFPAIAWWNDSPGLEHSASTLKRWASHDFATDWGARDVAASDKLYDPTSYHQGSVWPLYTGWAAMAQYRSGHPLAGFQAAMQNVDLTIAQDIGAVTELLSGDFFDPFGRSTSHQLWSSAMVITPVLRGLFGLEVDGLNHTVKVTPNLPAAWASAKIHKVHIGDSVADISLRRESTNLVITAATTSGPEVKLVGARDGRTLSLPLPAVEVSLEHALPLPGARTAQMKVLGEIYSPRSVHLELEGTGGTTATLHARLNDPRVHPRVEGAILTGDTLSVTFPAGTGYQSRQVTLSW